MLDAKDRSRVMQRVKQRNTAPDMCVRTLLHRMGYRYRARLHRKDLLGTPDIALPRPRLALIVHGCCRHGPDCRRGRLPKSRSEFWEPKIAGNRARDHRKDEQLEAKGWRVEEVRSANLMNYQLYRNA